MNVGVTFVFYEKRTDSIFGILKSLVLEVEKVNFNNKTDEIGNKIANHYGYFYLGINDVFSVTGKTKNGEILGRTTYYEYDKIVKAKTLKNNFFKNPFDYKINICACSLIYFCENDKGEKFTITVVTIVESEIINFENYIQNIANKEEFKNKIIKISIDGLTKLDYIGIESFKEIDLEFNIFETLYSEFKNLDSLSDEIIQIDNFNIMLDDVFNKP